jgi:hypothetical protein
MRCIILIMSRGFTGQDLCRQRLRIASRWLPFDGSSGPQALILGSDPARSFWTRFLTELAGRPIVIGPAAFMARTEKPELETFASSFGGCFADC